MSLDPYDPCPCGSGKKFKFCCQPVIQELGSIERLMDDENYKQALIVIEKCGRQHPPNRIVLQHKVAALQELNRFEESRQAILEYNQAFPGEPYAVLSDLQWRVYHEDWESVRPLVEAQFRGLLNRNSEYARALALSISEQHFSQHRWLAGLNWFKIAIVLSGDNESRAAVHRAIGSVMQSTKAPVRFIPDLDLRPLPEGQPNQEQFDAAMELANGLEWFSAGKAFEQLAEKDPHQPIHYLNAGLCYGFAGELPGSIEMLGQAADELPDFEQAVELETIAQWQEMELPEERVPRPRYHYRSLAPVSKLLTEWDKNPWLIRTPIQNRRVVAAYEFRDRPRGSQLPLDPLNPPRVLATVVVYSSKDEADQYRILITAYEGLFSAEHLSQIIGPVNEMLEQFEQSESNIFVTTDSAELDRYHLNVDFSDWETDEAAEQASQQFFEHFIYEVWPKTSLRALDDMTPEQVARDPELHLPLCASILTLARFVMANGLDQVDIARLRKQLNLPEITPLIPKAGDSISRLGYFGQRRIPYDALPDDEARMALLYALQSNDTGPKILEYAEYLYNHRDEFKGVSLSEVCRVALRACDPTSSVDLCRTWLQRIRQLLEAENASLMDLVRLYMQEMLVEVHGGNEDTLSELMTRLQREVFHKVPEFRSQCIEEMTSAGVYTARIKSIVEGSELVGVSDGTVSSGGIWTPGATDSSSGGKLWVPGE